MPHRPAVELLAHHGRLPVGNLVGTGEGGRRRNWSLRGVGPRGGHQILAAEDLRRRRLLGLRRVQVHAAGLDGDGFCCDNGQGQWVMALGEQTVARVTAGQFRTRQVLFQVGDQTTTTTSSSTFATTTTNVATTTTTDATTTTTTATTAAATTTDSSTSSPTSTPTATAAPTTDPWLTFNPRHSKFCGPKVVGGFAVAVSQCGPKTMCGLTTQSNHYGSHGNDCPKGLMCYSDIVCQNGPNAQNAISSSGRSVDGQYYSTREESLDGRTIGSIKSNEVVLKQDVEHGRWFPEEERMDALHEDNANVSTMRTLDGVLYCAIVGVFAIMNPWFS
eukprot:CCRYP_012195-RA/>CCRYP_012195-RA protein AED:0.28 eAED:0.28 QI:0/-1/0/1/-1/1/1/0/331